MLTPNEIGRMNQSLERFKARIDAAKKAAGWGVTDWFFDLLYIGGHPRQDVREAATGQRLYDALKAKANSLIEKPLDYETSLDGMPHEESLEIIQIADKAAKWDRADAINGFRKATDTGGALGSGLQKTLEEALKILKWALYITIVGLALYVYSWLPKKRSND